MRSFRSEPFLWIHLAGLAVVPLTLQLVWLGLAIGKPLTPYWLELLAVGLLGIAPVLWMQWSRPFDIFSLLILAIRPDTLNPEQQKILTILKLNRQRILALLTAIFMTWVLIEIYQFAPVAGVAVTNIPLPHGRIFGLLVAIIGFLLSNLFIQVPISVLGVMLTSEQNFAAINPYTTDQIRQQFTIFGIRVKRILPISED